MKSKIEGLNIKNTGIDVIIQKTDTLPEQNKQEEICRINFNAPVLFKQRLQIYCIQNNLSITDCIINTISDFLDKKT